jgi:hypothetical protein
VWYVWPSALVACAAYARGDFQAFSIGALIPCVSLYLGGPAQALARSSNLGAMVYLLVCGGICGVVAALTRRWIERHSPGGS